MRRVSGSEISGEEFRRKKEGVCWAGKLLTIAGAGKEGVSTRIGGGTRGGTRGGRGGKGWRAKQGRGQAHWAA